MTGYITNGVLIGLHDHKAGQYRAIQKVRCISVSLLALVIIACSLCTGDGGPKSVHRPLYIGLTLAGKVCEWRGPSSPFDFPIGYVGTSRIVRDCDSVLSRKGLPEFGFVHSLSFPAPGVFASPHRPDSAVSPLSTDFDFGLPESPPLWRFTERGLPAGIVHDDINLSQPAQAVLASPVWPARVWLVDDTAVVDGLLTFHGHGLLSFELVSESHPALGFGAAVQEAIHQSTCFPSVDKRGNRITVRCRYRCLFVQGAQSSIISVGPSVTAIMKRR
jgi:hypothetical protein